MTQHILTRALQRRQYEALRTRMTGREQAAIELPEREVPQESALDGLTFAVKLLTTPKPKCDRLGYLQGLLVSRLRTHKLPLIAFILLALELNEEERDEMGVKGRSYSDCLMLLLTTEESDGRDQLKKLLHG